MPDVIILVGMVGILVITISNMWFNECICSFDTDIRELKEALEEAEQQRDDALAALCEIKHIVVNDDHADYITKAKVYKLFKSVE